MARSLLCAFHSLRCRQTVFQSDVWEHQLCPILTTTCFISLFKTYIYSFRLQWVLVITHGIFNLRCGRQTLSCNMWDLIPWSGIEPRPPALGPWSLSHWTTREVSVLSCAKHVAQSCQTLYDPMNCIPPGSCPWGFSRQEYWSGLPCPPPGGKSLLSVFLNCSYSRGCIVGFHCGLSLHFPDD